MWEWKVLDYKTEYLKWLVANNLLGIGKSIVHTNITALDVRVMSLK